MIKVKKFKVLQKRSSVMSAPDGITRLEGIICCFSPWIVSRVFFCHMHRECSFSKVSQLNYWGWVRILSRKPCASALVDHLIILSLSKIIILKLFQSYTFCHPCLTNLLNSFSFVLTCENTFWMSTRGGRANFAFKKWFVFAYCSSFYRQM